MCYTQDALYHVKNIVNIAKAQAFPHNLANALLENTAEVSQFILSPSILSLISSLLPHHHSRRLLGLVSTTDTPRSWLNFILISYYYYPTTRQAQK